MAGTACRPRFHGRRNTAQPGTMAADCRRNKSCADRCPALRARRAARATLWDDIKFWRFAGIGGALAAMLFATIMVGALTTSRHLRNDLIALAQSKPIYVAVLVNDTTREAGAIVNAFSNGRVELVPLRPIEVPPAARCRSGRCGIAPLARNRSASPASHARCSLTWSRCRRRCKISCSRSRWSPKAALRSDGRPVRSCSRATRRGRCNGGRRQRRSICPRRMGRAKRNPSPSCVVLMGLASLYPSYERSPPTSARNTRRTSASVSRTRASSVEKSGVSPARAMTRSRFSPEVSGLNLSVTHSLMICVRS